jgi:hypothetical protein
VIEIAAGRFGGLRLFVGCAKKRRPDGDFDERS